MGFLKALKSFLSEGSQQEASEAARTRLRDAWGLDDSPSAGLPVDSPIAPTIDAEAASEYDKTQWQRKLHRIFEGLPDSQKEWPNLMTEAHSLNLDDPWIASKTAEEFTFLVRGIVADRVVSEEEQRRIETTRQLIGLSEDQAVAVLRAVAADAEQFFGAPVETEL